MYCILHSQLGLSDYSEGGVMKAKWSVKKKLLKKRIEWLKGQQDRYQNTDINQRLIDKLSKEFEVA